MHGGAAQRAWPQRTDLWWQGKIVGSLYVRRATLARAEQGRELFRCTGLMEVKDYHIVTKLGVQPINVRAIYMSEFEDVTWVCDRALDFMRATEWMEAKWVV